jgi:ABC-type multidrug transport system ATPase subunit
MNIQAREIQVGYLKNQVVLSVSSVVIDETDKFVLIKGDNGSGKTTLIRALIDAMPYRSGQIFVNGQLLTKHNRNEHLKNMGFCLTTGLSYSNMSLRQNFRIYDLIYDAQISLFDDLVERFRLQQIIDLPISTLSLGKRKLADIVLALSHSPALVFMDEPTANLDAETISLLSDTLDYYSSNFNMQFVIATNEANVFSNVVSKEIFIQDGKAY